MQFCHYKLAHFQIINWDVALSENETPIVIKYSLLDSSPFHFQSIGGPILGEMTGDVLNFLKEERFKSRWKGNKK